MEGVNSHVIFTLKDSRYDLQRIKREKVIGFIAPTYPFFEGEEEEFIIKILCYVALELGLRIAAFNFCGDHVHAVLITETSDISKIMGLWKGKSAYLFNHQNRPTKENSSSNNMSSSSQNLWAKSYYQKTISSSKGLNQVIYYVNSNRKKHGLAPLKCFSIDAISNIISKINP
jgi:REP element-mobilizing transposase RayT